MENYLREGSLSGRRRLFIVEIILRLSVVQCIHKSATELEKEDFFVTRTRTITEARARARANP